MSAQPVASYSTFVFDCDGVILDSNRLKTEAFRTSALPYGAGAAQALVDFHVANGGISRFVKFRHFLDAIVPGEPGPGIDALLAAYADAIADGLRSCAVVEGLTQLREVTRDAPWLIVSGGAQDELREVFAERGIDSLFDGGIYGSPETKDAILARELENGTIAEPALYIGDSVYDWRAATGAGLDFVFANWWTEVADWQHFVSTNDLVAIAGISEIPRSR